MCRSCERRAVREVLKNLHTKYDFKKIYERFCKIHKSFSNNSVAVLITLYNAATKKCNQVSLYRASEKVPRFSTNGSGIWYSLKHWILKYDWLAISLASRTKPRPHILNKVSDQWYIWDFHTKMPTRPLQISVKLFVCAQRRSAINFGHWRLLPRKLDCIFAQYGESCLELILQLACP